MHCQVSFVCSLIYLNATVGHCKLQCLSALQRCNVTCPDDGQGFVLLVERHLWLIGEGEARMSQLAVGPAPAFYIFYATGWRQPVMYVRWIGEDGLPESSQVGNGVICCTGVSLPWLSPHTFFVGNICLPARLPFVEHPPPPAPAPHAHTHAHTCLAPQTPSRMHTRTRREERDGKLGGGR